MQRPRSGLPVESRFLGLSYPAAGKMFGAAFFPRPSITEFTMRIESLAGWLDRVPDMQIQFPWISGLDRASPGNDVLLGTGRPESLAGLAGDDVILASGGNDTVFGDTETGPVPDFGGRPPAPDAERPGDNLILGGAGADSITAGWETDTVFGGSGDDRIIGYGGGFPSPAGFDAFLRGDGPDLLLGDAGDDTLLGGGAADTLYGGRGSDALTGGYGADFLVGGPGADRFVFAPQDPFGSSSDSPAGEGSRDVILDFGRGDDRIDLSAYQARFGAGLAADFRGTEEFVAAPGLQIRYEIEDDITLVQFTRYGGGGSLPVASTGEIELVGRHHLTEGDFLLA
jgi:hypothetical protein